MSVRTRVALLAAVALTATAVGQPPTPPPLPAPPPMAAADGPQIACEVRVLTLQDGFFERVGIDFDARTGVLNDAQMQSLMAAVQGDARSNVMQAPKVTTDDGEEAVVRITDRHFFVTGLEATRVNGRVVLVPKNTAVDTGTTLTVCGKASADGKAVTVRVNYKDTRVEGNVELVPVATQVAPVFEGGARGTPITFTQHLQAPQVETLTIEKKDLTIPSGGHAVIAGPTTMQEERQEFGPPFLSKIPYLNRMYKNVGVGRTAVRTYLVVSPKVFPADAGAVAASAAQVIPAQVPPTLIRLRNAAAADAAQAVTAHAVRHNLVIRIVADAATNSVVVSGEPGQQQEVIKLLAKLDAQPPQVVVKMVVAKVKAGFAEEIGLADDGKPGESAWVLTPRELRMINAAFRMSKEQDEIEVLSRPQLLVQDNQTGYVQVGPQVAVPAATAGDPGQNPQNVKYVNAGVTTRVTARIGADGKSVLLRAELQHTEVAPMPVNLGNGMLTPAFNQQAIQTTSVVPFGGTLAFRGRKMKDAKGGETEVMILMTVEKVEVEK